MTKPTYCLRALFACGLIAGLGGLIVAQDPGQPVRRPPDPGVVTTRQAIAPAGVQSVFDGRVYGISWGQDGNRLWVLTSRSLFELDWASNLVRQRVDLPISPGLQGLWFDGARRQAIVAGASRTRKPNMPPAIRLLSVGSSGETPGSTPAAADDLGEDLGTYLSGALAVAARPRSDGGHLAVVPLTYDNAIAVVDLTTRRPVGRVSTGIAPFGVALDATGSVAWVSNWGGRVPLPTDLTAPTGEKPGADQVVVDARGVAASGTLSRIDLVSMRLTHTINVGRQPTAIVWDEAAARLYVSNSNDDSVSVVDTARFAVVETIDLRPFGPGAAGVAPTALALAPDGTRLFVACGGINAVAVVSRKTGTIEGLIPTAWYPNAIAVSPVTRMIAVGTLLGAGSGWRRSATASPPPDPARRYVHAARGAIAVLPLPSANELRNYTLAVAENNHLPLQTLAAATPALTRPERASAATAVPMVAGDPSFIDHVVYIVKENRTYDQVLGDLPQGNGDASLVLFGEEVAPNHRKLAREFVLLDNFYATGGNSGDGHQWVTQANETAYAMWPGYTGRSYPFDGSDPIAYASGGFIWDAARQAKRTVRIYGEFVPTHTATPATARAGLLSEWRRGGADFSGRWTAIPRIEGMKGLVAPDFPAYSTAIPDVVRADLFLRDLRAWQGDGTMPNLVLLQLPSDHTYGTSPGLSTPRAMVADNDLALGRIVEGLTRSRFWPQMAIFVVEDDAQDGVDHVDGHRTIALVASPYARRRHVDSTFYSQPSILKTIELILGLPPLSIFDRIANDMRHSFTDTPDLTPYEAAVPMQSLNEVNPPASALSGAARAAALASAKMRFDVPDAAPTDQLNRTIWHAIKGWDRAYPGVRRAVFAPLSIDVDDEDRK